VTNGVGLVNSRPATLTVLEPLAITTQPASQTVAPGATVMFTVATTGNPPPTYQWRLNGVNIPGAVYSTLIITNVQRTNGGSYSVVVANIGAAIDSAIATLVVSGPALPFADNLSARGVITGSSGSGSGNNQSATSEFAEPNHAGKPGGKSLWLAWTAPATGIATFHTRGSGFDTLLAVYTGSNYSSLANLASDEDRGGFGTSEASFNTTAGTQYVIVIDGYAGASGNVLLTWTLDTTTVPFPRILAQPISVSVTNGATVAFSVQVNSPSATNFQWFHECRAVAGATNATLTITNVEREDVGNYHVVIVNASSHSAQSDDAFLEIGPQANAISKDKLEDLFLSGGPGFALQQALAVASGGFISVSAGTVGSQLFDNTGASTQQGEGAACGVIGGSSKWLGFVLNANNAVIVVDSIGSSLDTVLAVYKGSTLATLVYVACDNNGAPDGIRSLVRFTNNVAGTPYLVAVDGVGGAQGNLNLNWKFAGWPSCDSLTTNRTVHLGDNTTLRIAVSNPTTDTLYFWRVNGSVVSIGNTTNFTLNNLQPGQAGTYSVIVSNFAGSVTQTVASIGVASPVQIAGAMVWTNGTRVFRLSSPSGQSWVIEAASALTNNPAATNWLRLYTNSSQSGPVYFPDFASTNFPRRFYRVVPWP
jgi:hypothetical protein